MYTTILKTIRKLHAEGSAHSQEERSTNLGATTFQATLQVEAQSAMSGKY